MLAVNCWPRKGKSCLQLSSPTNNLDDGVCSSTNLLSPWLCYKKRWSKNSIRKLNENRLGVSVLQLYYTMFLVIIEWRYYRNHKFRIWKINNWLIAGFYSSAIFNRHMQIQIFKIGSLWRHYLSLFETDYDFDINWSEFE